MLDRVDLFADFNPWKHFALTITDQELVVVNATITAESADDIDLDVNPWPFPRPRA